VVPGCIVVAVFNAHLYGSPLTSGYSSNDPLFAIQYFWTNLSQYSRWLLEMETPFILLGFAGWFLLRRREVSDGTGRVGVHGRFSNLILSFSLVLYACYAIYVPFDNWTFLRFLLPAIALLLTLCAVTLSAFGERLHSFHAKVLAVACFVVFLAWRWDVMGLKPPRPQDRQAAVIGGYVRDHLPQNAVVFSFFQAGSVRYYSGRLTLRWDWMSPESLDRSVTFLTSNGYRPFLLITEDWERTQFLQKFSGRSKVWSPGLKPVATHEGVSRADLYDLGNPVQPSTSVTIAPPPPQP
jgi:hypothetical protein